MLYITIIFIIAGGLFIFGYFILAILNILRIKTVRKYTDNIETLTTALMEKDYYYIHPKFDMLSIIMVSDFTSDPKIRNNIKKVMNLILKKE